MRLPSAAVAWGAPAILGVLGCGRTEASVNLDSDGSSTGELDATTSAEPAGPGSVVGCQEEPLRLGAVSDVESAAADIVWMGDTFAVGWLSPEGYQVVITNGSSLTSTLLLTEMTASTTPQLIRNGAELELYYAREDSVFVDTLDWQDALRVTGTQQVGTGPGFRAVVTEPGSVAVLARSTLFIHGEQRDSNVYWVGAVGYDGDYFLYSSVLGHGEWTLYGIHPDGTPNLDAMELRWNGLSGTGRAAGSSFASSAGVGRHAVAIAADGQLTFAIEGLASFEREILFQQADISAFWDGERYVVLLANGPVNGETANRDIELLAFSAAGHWLPETDAAWTISQHASDERFPVGASAMSGDYGIAWIQDGTLVLQRCALTVG